jgi:hypothetical protein
MKDKKLNLLCKKFLQSSLEIYGKLISPADQLPIKNIVNYKFKEDRSGYTSTTNKVTDYSFIITIWDKICDSRNFKKFSDYMFSNPEIRGFNTIREIQMTLPFSFLQKYLERSETMEFEDEVFKELYESLENYLFCDSVTHRTFIILSNLNIESKDMVFNDVKLAHISEKDFTKLISGFSHIHKSNPFEFTPKKMLLERKYKMIKNPESKNFYRNKEQKENTTNLFNKIMLSFRLFKKGAIGYNAIYDQNISEWRHGLARSSPHPMPHFFGLSYKLNKTEENELKRFWKFIKEVKIGDIDKNLNLAIRRFNSAYEKKNDEDRLIDCVIALESLLSKKGERNIPLRFKLGIRTALLLGKNTEEREIIKQEIQEIYDARSRMVHGGEVTKLGVFKDLKDLVDSAEEYVRMTIKALLQLDIKYGRMSALEKLDEYLLSANFDLCLDFL